jgi:hypothetical protein
MVITLLQRESTSFLLYRRNAIINMSPRRCLNLLFTAVLLCAVPSVVSGGRGKKANTASRSTVKRDNKRGIQIINESGSVVVEIFWVNPQTKEQVLMSDPHILPGTEFKLDSYVGHEFAVREKASGVNKECKNEDKVCRQVLFKVSENDSQVARLTPEFDLVFEDNKLKARKQATDLLQDCRKIADAKMNATKTTITPQHQAAIVQDLIQCVQGGVASELERVHEEIAFQSSVRTNIAAHLENYTCVDDSLDSTPDVETTAWVDKGVTRTVHIKHERPASKIHVIESFIDEEECIAMETEAALTLHRATVADGKGGSRLSHNRKALQAGIKVQWDKEQQGDAIARLSRRVYDYANYVLGLDIKEQGQEDLMSIQYKGRGKNDTEPDVSEAE